MLVVMTRIKMNTICNNVVIHFAARARAQCKKRDKLCTVMTNIKINSNWNNVVIHFIARARAHCKKWINNVLVIQVWLGVLAPLWKASKSVKLQFATSDD